MLLEATGEPSESHALRNLVDFEVMDGFLCFCLLATESSGLHTHFM